MPSPNMVKWRCMKCGSAGTVPLIDGATFADWRVRDAITRGHERKDIDCHPFYGLKHIVAEHDGKRMRYGNAPREDGPETVAGREVSRR